MKLMHVTRLNENGVETAVSFRVCGDHCYALDVTGEPMYPLIILIK